MSIIWGLELKNSVSTPAIAMANAMASAASQAKALAGAMTSAQNALVKARALGDVEGVRSATVKYYRLKEAFDTLKPAVDAAAAAESKLAKETENAEKLAGNAAIGLGAMAVAAAAIGAAVYEAGRLAIEASENVKRLTATFDALGEDGAHAGAATVAMIRGIAKEIPESEAQIAGWARTLEGAGVTDLSQLRESLKAVASAEALVQGGGEQVKNTLAKLEEQSLKGGGKVKFSLAQLAGTGVTEPEFLAALGMTPEHFAAAKKAGTLGGKEVSDAIVKALATKATGPLAAQMDELSTLEVKAADGAKHLFEDVDTGPFTAAVKNLFSTFDEAQPSGAVIKDAITGAFNAIMTTAGKVTDFVQDAFLRLIIVGLQVELAYLHNKTVFEALGAVLTGAVLGAIVGLTVAMWGYAAAAWSAAVATLAATWPFLAIGAAIGFVIFLIVELVRHWSEVKTFFGNLSDGAFDAANAFISGLVNGIASGVRRAVDAVKHLGSSLVKGINDVLDSHSPSRVLFEVGANTSSSFAGGIEAGTGNVESAADRLGAAAIPSGPGGGGSGSGGGGGGTVVHLRIDGIHIDASGAASPGEVRQIVAEELAALGEKIGLMVGAAPPANA